MVPTAVVIFTARNALKPSPACSFTVLGGFTSPATCAFVRGFNFGSNKAMCISPLARYLYDEPDAGDPLTRRKLPCGRRFVVTPRSTGDPKLASETPNLDWSAKASRCSDSTSGFAPEIHPDGDDAGLGPWLHQLPCSSTSSCGHHEGGRLRSRHD